MEIVPQAEEGVSALETCTTTFASVQIDVFAPRVTTNVRVIGLQFA